MSSQTEKKCGWSGRLPDFQESSICQSCQKLRTAGQITRCRIRGGPEIEGLGDVVAIAAKVTGVKAVVDLLTGGDCGCPGRQAALNRAVPFSGNEAE